MSSGKANKKKVDVKEPGEILLSSVVSAILARGSDDVDGARICSVKKIKDYILENEPKNDPNLLNVRLKETLVQGVEERIIARPKSQSELRTDLRGSFCVVDKNVSSKKAVETNNNVKKPTAAKTAKTRPAEDEVFSKKKAEDKEDSEQEEEEEEEEEEGDEEEEEGEEGEEGEELEDEDEVEEVQEDEGDVTTEEVAKKGKEEEFEGEEEEELEGEEDEYVEEEEEEEDDGEIEDNEIPGSPTTEFLKEKKPSRKLVKQLEDTREELENLDLTQ